MWQWKWHQRHIKTRIEALPHAYHFCYAVQLGTAWLKYHITCTQSGQLPWLVLHTNQNSIQNICWVPAANCQQPASHQLSELLNLIIDCIVMAIIALYYFIYVLPIRNSSTGGADTGARHFSSVPLFLGVAKVWVIFIGKLPYTEQNFIKRYHNIFINEISGVHVDKGNSHKLFINLRFAAIFCRLNGSHSNLLCWI